MIISICNQHKLVIKALIYFLYLVKFKMLLKLSLPVPFGFLNVATRKFIITYVVCLGCSFFCCAELP